MRGVRGTCTLSMDPFVPPPQCKKEPFPATCAWLLRWQDSPTQLRARRKCIGHQDPAGQGPPCEARENKDKKPSKMGQKP